MRPATWVLVNPPNRDISKIPSGYRYICYMVKNGFEVYQAYHIYQEAKDRPHAIRQIKKEIKATNKQFLHFS